MARVLVAGGSGFIGHALVTDLLARGDDVGGPLGSGAQGFPRIHLDDEVAALERGIDDPALSGAVNLCTPDPLSNAEREPERVWSELRDKMVRDALSAVLAASDRD